MYNKRVIDFANRKTAFISAAAICALFIAALSIMGRIAFGENGFGLWTWNPASSDTSQLFGDPYSFSHVLHGIIFFWLLTLLFRKMSFQSKFLTAMMIEIAWEILENSPFIINRYRTATAALDYYGDSILNSVADLIFCMLGFYMASKLHWKWSVVLFALIELIMLATIKDNLTLNVVMLLFPIQAIKNWQLSL
jgi:hypothetical protein